MKNKNHKNEEQKPKNKIQKEENKNGERPLWNSVDWGNEHSL